MAWCVEVVLVCRKITLVVLLLLIHNQAGRHHVCALQQGPINKSNKKYTFSRLRTTRVVFFNEPQQSSQQSVGAVSSSAVLSLSGVGAAAAEDADDNNNEKLGVHGLGAASAATASRRKQWKRSNSASANNYKNQKSITIDLSKYEEKERREMEWLVETTSKILGLDDSEESRQPVGSMPDHLTRRAFKLMRAWSQRSSEPHVVDLILKRLLTEVAAGNQHVRITTNEYNAAIDAWSRSAQSATTPTGNNSTSSSSAAAAERCEQLLQEMEISNTVRPNTQSYNSVMKAYVNNEQWKSKSYPKVKELFDRIGSQKSSNITANNNNNNSLEKDWNDSPNRGSYHLLFSAIINDSKLKDKGEVAESLLRLMKVQQSMGDEKVAPIINTYNYVIIAWSQSSGESSSKSTSAQIMKVYEELLESGIQPNADTFNHILSEYAKSRNIQKMQEILKFMEATYCAGNEAAKPNRVTANTVVSALAKQSIQTAIELGISLETKYSIEPDTISNNILIDCWSKSGDKDAAARAVHLLDKMEHDYKRYGTLRPDVYTYSSVINTLAKRGEQGRHAQYILRRMRYLHDHHNGDPANTSVFNACINALASSKSDDAMIEALALLEEMKERHKLDPFVPKPDITTFNSILKVLCTGGDQGAMKANEILTKLEQSDEYSPDAFTYTSVINAFGRSNFNEKAEYAYEVLRRMIAAHERGNAKTRPNIRAFNAVLNACAFVNGDSKAKLEAFTILVATTTMMTDHQLKSDGTTYGTILRACSQLLPPGDKRRAELVETIFLKACREGLVSPLVLKQMKFAASSGQYQKLLGRNIANHVRTNDLPASWTSNVRENKRRHER